MESVLNQRSSNDSSKNELVGAKYQLNTSPQQDTGGDSPITSPITSPPYWIQSHQRSSSAISIESIPNGAITLQDNTDGEDGKNKACWAKSVYIEDHVIINGSRMGIGGNLGAFVVWNITVETLHGGTMRIRKRYSEFDDLRHKLLQTFPYSAAAMPPLPPKSVISKFRPKFLENRRAKLQYFLKCAYPLTGWTIADSHSCILLNPEFSGSPVLKEFLFS
ncbi:Phox-like protein [Hyaloscypha variabilis F]|uniref:Endosomal/vacuolar adapter protein YPT35 n=1 Tax=Hyaloscypha variabilis (strain UAMH 11265 / GT02V1 / F) TaxID=1149755 RepID=A0A2J6RI32_HYAVF|nr:Phox-like protein [Hyaloscypha variabilis F]